MMPMSRHFGEVHGVDVSDEMIALARQRLRDIPNAHLHATAGTDLSMFSDAWFDFVYSYIVFQHIRAGDCAELPVQARQVLKPGSVLCCQIRGTAPLASEVSRESETWTGCYFNAGEVAQFARERSFPLVALSGLDTQYMWTTFRKPLAVEPYEPERVSVNAVTAAGGPAASIPTRGRDAAVSLWVEGMPESASLADCAVWFGDREQLGCYLSPISQNGGCQLNARLPDGLAPGEYPVQLRIQGQPVSTSHGIAVVAPPPWAPRVLSVADGINVTALYRVESGAAKVVIEDVPRSAQVSFAVGGQPVGWLTQECRDAVTSRYEFTFHLADKTPRGRQQLKVCVDGRVLDPIDVDVVWRKSSGVTAPDSR